MNAPENGKKLKIKKTENRLRIEQYEHKKQGWAESPGEVFRRA